MRKAIYLLFVAFILLVGCQEETQEAVENEEKVIEQEEQKVENLDDKEQTTENESVSLDDFDLPERTKGFFWSGTDGNNQFHFLGTIHIGTEDMYPFEEEIESALETSDFLLLEKDFSSEEAKNLREEYSFYPTGETLEDHMPEGVIDSVREYSTTARATFNQLNRMKPYALSNAIFYYEIRKKGLSGEYSAENYLTEKKPQDTKIIGLEGQESYELVYNQSDDYNAHMLEKFFNNLDEQINQSVKALAGYRLGDESMLTSINRTVDTDDESQKYEQMYIDNIMVKRDRIMADRIAELSNEHSGKTFFVAIGTAHFFNEGNVLELLEDEGFEIERK